MALVCNGYGSAHGSRGGRLWFACGACRWRAPAQPAPRADVSQQLDREIAALQRALEAEQEALGLDVHG